MDHIKLNAKPNKRNTSNVEQELKDTLCTESNKKVYPFRQYELLDLQLWLIFLQLQLLEYS